MSQLYCNVSKYYATNNRQATGKQQQIKIN